MAKSKSDTDNSDASPETARERSLKLRRGAARTGVPALFAILLIYATSLNPENERAFTIGNGIVAVAAIIALSTFPAYMLWESSKEASAARQSESKQKEE